MRVLVFRWWQVREECRQARRKEYMWKLAQHMQSCSKMVRRMPVLRMQPEQLQECRLEWSSQLRM